MGGQALAHHGADHTPADQGKHQGQAGGRPMAQGRQGHQAVDGDQQQAGATGQRHRQPRQQHQGRHDCKASPYPGDACKQAHEQPLNGQGQGRAAATPFGCGGDGLAAAEQPGGQQGRGGKQAQLHWLGHKAGLHQAAADPAAGQGGHPQD